MHSSTTRRQVEAIGSCISTTLSGIDDLSQTEQVAWLHRHIDILYFTSTYGLPLHIAARIADSGKPIEYWLTHFPELFI
jgi:hypothetical protein